MRIVSTAIVVLLTTGILSTASTVMGEPSEVSDHGIVFGRSRHFSGIYFSNFENSKFTECDRANDACKSGDEGLSEAVHCAPSACLDLERRIKQLVGSHDKWALYAMDFIGRRSTQKTPKTFIGDTENKVYVERITHFSLIRTE